MTRALLLFALLLTVGEITGVLDAVLDSDCAVTCSGGGEDGCTLCPCCQQGRIACPDLPAQPQLAVSCERVELQPVLIGAAAPLERIFHPPRLVSR